MASVNGAQETQGQVQQATAQEHLEYALGKKKISFGDLPPEVADKLLKDVLYDLDLRDLRGFKPLRDLLTFRPGSITYGREEPHTLDIETLELSPEVKLWHTKPMEGSADLLGAHFLWLGRGMLNHVMIFKRYETDDETHDPRIAYTWGRSGYLYKGAAAVLALGRPRNHTHADQNLFKINYWYEKVPAERKHLIVQIQVSPLPFENLRGEFGPQYPQIAVEVIWDLRIVYAHTRDEHKRNADFCGKKIAELERISNSITYHLS